MRRWSSPRLRSLIIIALVVIGLAVFAHHALAQATTLSIESVGSQIGLGNADLRTVIINVIRWVLGFITLAAVVYIMYGGYLWLTAGGDAKRIEKAKQVILQALIGLVIILLAWAIVFFVARTFSRVTTNNNTNSGNGGCVGLGCPTAQQSDFNIIGITSCAQRPEYDENVPRSSSINLTFNTRVDETTVKKAVEDTTASPNLVIERCDDMPGCTTWSKPRPIDNQVFTSGTSPKGVKGATLAEWLANKNTVTFYHLNYSDDPTDLLNNRWFEPDRTYRITVPKEDTSKASTTVINDARGRVLKHCYQDPLTPIEGGGCAENGNVIQWTFTTGADTDGPALAVSRTAPTSAYRSGTGVPDQNVNRTPIISVSFNNAIDPNSLGAANFQVFKLAAKPDVANRASWQVSATPLPASAFDFDYTANGAVARVDPASPLEPFTWYMVSVKDVRNLCGTLMQDNPYEWVFETNDTVPGVKLVYPKNGYQNACPATEVFIQFATSMWKPGSFDCQVGAAGTYVTNGSLSPSSSRAFQVVNQYDPNDPNGTCTKYAFAPTTVLLSPNTNYTASVNTNLVIDQNGTKLSKSWSFKTATADSCVQEPYISRVDPSSDQAGACLSVLGNYFEKKPPASTIRESDGQNAGDKLELATVTQPVKAWSNQAIVTSVTPTGLPDSQPHPYKVTVNYAAPIGPLESNTVDFFLQPGTAAAGSRPCLLSLSPDNGPVGTGVDAKGEDFGTNGTKSKVQYTLGSTVDWNVQANNWNNTTINNSLVTANSQIGQGVVRVMRDSDQALSNALPFEVTSPTGTGGNTLPKVVEDSACDAAQNIIPSPNPKKGDTQACLNTLVTARFSLPMDQASITTPDHIYLEKCDPSCAKVPSNVAFVPDRGFTLTPGQALTPATQYRVTITTAVKSSTNQALAAPYVWTFTTKTDTSNCPVQSVAVVSGVVQGTATQSTSSSFTFRDVPYGVGMTASALGAECRTITSGASFSWTNSKPTVATLTSNTGATIVGYNPPTPDIDTTAVQASAEGKKSGNVSITYDPTICTTSSQCATGACSASTCVNNRCTPVITAVDKDNGPVGDWTTIKGCYFGGFNTTTSRVIFRGNAADPADDQDGRSPDPTICGSPAATWTNTYIVREVPNAVTLQTTDDAKTGPVRVVRADGQTADGPIYTVNTNPLTPGLCKVSPTQGIPTVAFTANGARFGVDEPTKRPNQDQVSLTQVSSGAATVMSTYTSWSDQAINTITPSTTPLGTSEVRVKNEGINSNPWPFTVLDPATAGGQCQTKICAVDSDCAVGFGCARDFCCRPRPKIQSAQPAQGSTNVCRNAQTVVTFDQPLDGSTVTSSTLRYLDGATAKSGSIDSANTATTGTITYQPGLLTATTPQTLHLTTAAGTTEIRAKNGVLADVASGPITSPIRFTTGPDICKVGRVIVDPASYRFTAVNQSLAYQAYAIASTTGDILANLPGVYAWTWGWQSGSATVATVTGNAAAANQSTGQATVTAKANGATTAQATATVTVDNSGGTVPTSTTGRGDVRVEICDNPWTIAGQPQDGYTDSDFHFQMFYCRGQGTNQATLLPNFDYVAIEGTKPNEPSRLKSIFFKEDAGTRDAIGVLVYDNPNFLSPLDWYHQRFPLDTGGSQTIIAGYPAVRIGTTAYIGVTDLNGSTMRGLILVIDYNSNNATAATKNIFAKMLSSLTFNTNLADPVQKQQLMNDTKRRQDISSLQLLVEAYKQAHGTYPTLVSGSYLSGMSTSAWPSWQQTLGNTLGRTVPSDPINGFSPDCKPPTVSAGDAYEPSTCWSETTKRFQCPSGSHIYAYRQNGTGYQLFAHMEYTGTGSFGNRNPSTDACSGFAGSACACFNYVQP